MKVSFKTIFGVVSLILFFSLGLFVCVSNTNSIEDLPTLELARNTVSRDPAAIRRTYDFSMLEGSALESAAKNRLLSGFKVVSEAGDVGVGLGHFVIKGLNGEKTFACQHFSKIALSFEGDGVAVNGELPKMEVEGVCEMSADINSISPLMIPVAMILGEPVGDGEFNFREGKPISVRFVNVTDQWPTTWQLKGVRLFENNKDDSEQVVISAEEMKSFSSKPLILHMQK